jgi:chromosome segregation ATPase
MTTRREVPFSPDGLGWVHNELAEIKSKLALVQQAAEHSRGLAIDAAEKSHQVENKLEPFAGHSMAIMHLQDDLHVIREQFVRTQEDINSLRQSRDEIERRFLADSERVRQDRNDISRRFAEVERQIEGWQEHLASTEEHNRRNLEAIAQVSTRIEPLQNALLEVETLLSRLQSQVSRVDQEINRLSGSLANLDREDGVQHERTDTAFEMLRRLEAQLESVRAETNPISRIQDRLELVQAERTRHNERLNEMTAELADIEARLHDQTEKAALIETRMAAYQDAQRALTEAMQTERERVAAYLRGLAELEADFRKRQTAALEKETRDLRNRALSFAEE